MNALGLHLVWTALQVSTFCLAGAILYLIARRRNPASGAWAAALALVVAIGISALAVSPWPRWWSLEPENTQAAPVDRPAVRPATSGAANDRLAPGLMSGPIEPRDRGDRHHAVALEPAPRSTWRSVYARLRDELSPSSSVRPTAGWRWPAWLAMMMLAGSALAMTRLMIAVVAARQYSRRSQRVDDPSLTRLLNDIRNTLGVRRLIEPRETSQHCSPSTIGWLRPILILPMDWRTWNGTQRRAVLAHEVAHVARNDFATGLLAQLGIVLHFYNPLVHWLADRLRLEQEMAADVCGAQFAGGKQTYLTTLAEMALRTHDAPLAWAARPFLPTRGTLMRRIEMLHHEKRLPNLSDSRLRRVVLSAILLITAGVVVGIRGPQGERMASAEPPKAAGSVAVEAFNLDFVPMDAQFLFALRPAELAEIESLATLKAAMEKLGAFAPLDLPPEKLDECKFVIGADRQTKKHYQILVLRSEGSHDWTEFGDKIIGDKQAATENGHSYFRSTAEFVSSFSAYWLPDDRTIVLSRADLISNLFALRAGANEPTWATAWKTVATSPVACAVSPTALQQVIAEAGGRVDGDILRAVEGPVLFWGSEIRGLFRITGRAQCSSQTAAEELKLDISVSVDDLKRIMHGAIAQPAMFDNSPFAEAMLRLLDATEIDVKDATVFSRTSVSQQIGRNLAASLGPARAAAQRALSVNKLKQIGIALWNYYDVHKHFPPAVIMGPDGKTPHSWRVELLPYLDKAELHKQYRLNEPWDSDHNRKLIAAGADLFSVPSEMPSEDCGYFALVGQGTAFDPAKSPITVRQVVDGTSKTVAIVEAKRSIPWTKPEDITYAPDKPLPAFGGFFNGGFDALYLDAHVTFLPDDVDEEYMRALITYEGRESTSFDPQTGVYKVGKPPK